MKPGDGPHMFQATGASYDAFMGRYSAVLAPKFIATLALKPGQRALDVGCGPGALTAALVVALGASAVSACDPSPGFVAECAARNPGVDVHQGRAEAIPFPDAHFDVAATQLVLHFVGDSQAASSELHRVVRPGGMIGACVWDADHGMEMLGAFWDAALEFDPDVHDTIRTLRLGRPGEIAALFAAAGLTDITETTIEVRSTYRDFDEVWAGFQAGIGPAGAYCTTLPTRQQTLLRDRMYTQLGAPTGTVTLAAVARSVTATRPSDI